MNAAQKLAIVRIVFFSVLFLVRGTGPYLRLWSEVPGAFWHPNGIMTLIPHSLISATVIDWLFEFWRWTLPLCALGLFYRWLAPVNWLTSFLLFNYAHSFGYQTHTYMPIILAGLPLAFSRAADAWSADNRLWPAVKNADYDQPLFNMRLVFALVFFAAGLSKLRNGGLEWFTGDTLRNYFLRASTIYSDVHSTAHHVSVNITLYDWPTLTRFMAATGVGLELLTPLTLWRRPLTGLIVLGLFVMQIVIYFTVFVNFSIYLALYSCWLPVIFENWPKVKNRD